MAQKTIRGQITIVDLNDAQQISVYFNNNSVYTQLYNPDTKKYTPNFAEAGKSVLLSPMVYVSGNAENQVGSLTNVQYTIKGGGLSNDVIVTTSKPSGSDFVVKPNSDANPFALEIKRNISPTATQYSIIFEATYVDTKTGLSSKLLHTITINLSQSAGALFQAVIECPKGNVFDASNSATSAGLTAVAKVYRGGTPDTSGTTFTWEKLDPQTGSFVALGTGSTDEKVSTSNNQSTLTVKPDNIDNWQIYRVKAEDEGNVAYALITFSDATDPYVLELVTMTGDKIINGQGSTTINARIYRSGELIEDESTQSKQFNYVWTKFNKDGTKTDWVNEAGVSRGESLTTNPIVVYNKDVLSKATVFCTATKK
jgi:hypothetical protein